MQAHNSILIWSRGLPIFNQRSVGDSLGGKSSLAAIAGTQRGQLVLGIESHARAGLGANGRHAVPGAIAGDDVRRGGIYRRDGTGGALEPRNRTIDRHRWSERMWRGMAARTSWAFRRKGQVIGEKDCPVLTAIRCGAQSLRRLTILGRGQQPVSVDAHVIPVLNERGISQGTILMLHDASSETSLEQRCQNLHEKATKDPLTQVSNRAEFDRFMPCSSRRINSNTYRAAC